MVNWDNIPNWSGLNPSGGTVSAVFNGSAGSLQVSGLNVMANGPQPGSSVVISSTAGATVTGPAAAANIGSLTLGSSSGNPNVLNLSSGPLNVTAPAGTRVNPTGVLTIDANNGGNSLTTTSLNVAGGSVSVLGGGQLTVNGAMYVSSGVLNVDPSSGLATSTTTSLTVTGGQATLNNIGVNTFGSATLSGGTTSLGTAGGHITVTSANVSGGAVVTVGAQSTLTNATVSGGYLNSAGSMSSLAVTGGTVILASGLTVGTADFSNPGTASITAAGPLNITSQLKYSVGAAAIAGGNTITYTPSSGSLNTTSPAGTLAFSGGVLTLSPNSSVGAAINVFSGGVSGPSTYTGAGPSADTGTVWNNQTAHNTTMAALLNSGSIATGVSYTSAGVGGSYNYKTAANPACRAPQLARRLRIRRRGWNGDVHVQRPDTPGRCI